MAYTDVEALKAYLGIDGSEDDALLDSLIGRAQAAIETYCGRKFEASASTTKYYDVTGSRTLFLDDDLLTLTTLTNGDDEEIASTEYQLLPLNETPKYAIRLKQGSTYNWESDSEGNTEGVIEVTGTWGWSTAAPNDIIHATVRLAGYFYKQKDAQVFDTEAIPDAGVIMVPKGIPVDVRIILDRYREPSL